LERRAAERPPAHLPLRVADPADREDADADVGARGGRGPAALLRLQAAAGNQAVAGLVGPQPAVQREDAPAGQGEEEELTEQEEQEWLEAPMQRNADLPVQRAWTGRRQLSGLGGLGRPWVVRKSGNLVNLRLYHEHIFFEDGRSPPDIGHMGREGLGQDPGRMGDYSRVREGLDDTRLRGAVGQRPVEPGSYSLLTNNCQDYVQGVLRLYDQQAAVEAGAQH
jgi:hypothetical protein